MREFTSRHEFTYPWEEVTAGNWRKYGDWNGRSAQVIAVDVVSRRVDPATGILRTERLLTCQQATPAWLAAVVGALPRPLVYELSYIDRRARTLTMLSHNLTWRDLLRVRETVRYTPVTTAAPAHGDATVFAQRAEISALCAWPRLQAAIEDTALERFRQNAVSGREGFETVLKMAKESDAG